MTTSPVASPSSDLPDSLFTYLATVLPGWKNPTDVKKFDTGQSNPTYCLTSASSSASADPSAQPGSPSTSVRGPASSTSPSPASTSFTDAAVRTVVLRAKPKGKVLDRTAHRVDREFGLLRAIGEHQARTGYEVVKVPKVFALCEDETVFGSVFYLMEFLKGERPGHPARLLGCLADSSSSRLRPSTGRIFTSVLLPSVEPSTRRA
jgi:aminoglycoside phosphotransferase (APT) family kinase protein